MKTIFFYHQLRRSYEVGRDFWGGCARTLLECWKKYQNAWKNSRNCAKACLQLWGKFQGRKHTWSYVVMFPAKTFGRTPAVLDRISGWVREKCCSYAPGNSNVMKSLQTSWKGWVTIRVKYLSSVFFLFPRRSQKPFLEKVVKVEFVHTVRAKDSYRTLVGQKWSILTKLLLWSVLANRVRVRQRNAMKFDRLHLQTILTSSSEYENGPSKNRPTRLKFALSLLLRDFCEICQF